LPRVQPRKPGEDPLVRHKILIFALTAALVTDIGLLVVLCPDGLAADFAAYWRAANSVHPYDFSITPFANPPTTLLWLQPLRFLPEWPAYLLLSLVSVLAFAAFGSRLYGLRATLLGFLSPPFVLGSFPDSLRSSRPHSSSSPFHRRRWCARSCWRLRAA